MATSLLVADKAQLILRCRLSEKVVDARFGRDGRRRHRVIAGDHHGADAHAAQFGKTFANAPLDDILKVDNAEQAAILRDGERRAACFRNHFRDRFDLTHDIRADGRTQNLGRCA
jgi:hypothetical protein